MGDPGGIGAEVIVQALDDPRIRGRARFVIYGFSALLVQEAERRGIEPRWFRIPHESARARKPLFDPVVVLDFSEFGEIESFPHEPSRAGGLASKAYVEEAITDALRPADDPRFIDALVTAPISKESWQMAGYRWPGHTELLENRSRAKRSAMMFWSPRLRVVLATTHLALMEIRNQLTIGRVFDPIDLGHEACRKMGIEHPRIAVTGLNPHAGEKGLFGDEEIRIIQPAIDLARRGGIDARGPFPADTIFIAAAAGEYDLVVAMYHDQGLIPVKLLGWDSAVNWTIGIPFVRTSPDHGTAFDIAGRAKASAGSMIAAIELALRVTENRGAERPPL